MKRLALVFPGQGSQFVGMGKELCQYFPQASNIFDSASDIVHLDLKKLCFNGDSKELMQTEKAQPALLTLSFALYQIYEQEIGITPYLAAGHSLGEYSALVCAKSISFSDALHLVQLRGQLMKEAAQNNDGYMAAIIGASRNIIEEVCQNCSQDDNLVTIANYNSPKQIVISGHRNAMQKACEQLATTATKVIPLEVSAAFHSLLMKEAADRFEAELKKVIINYPFFPVISNVTAEPYKNINNIYELLKKQILNCVQWVPTIKYMIANKITSIIEMGPKNVLRKLIESSTAEIEVFSANTEEDLLRLYQLDANDFANKRPNILERCLRLAVITPNNNWDNNEYTNGVIIPYRKIKDTYYQLADNNQDPSIGQMKTALILLRKILTTKKVSEEAQKNYFNQILEETGYWNTFTEKDWTNDSLEEVC